MRKGTGGSIKQLGETNKFGSHGTPALLSARGRVRYPYVRVQAADPNSRGKGPRPMRKGTGGEPDIPKESK